MSLGAILLCIDLCISSCLCYIMHLYMCTNSLNHYIKCLCLFLFSITLFHYYTRCLWVTQHPHSVCVSVYSYMLQYGQVLQKYELDAFLSMAASPVLHDVQTMQQLKVGDCGNYHCNDRTDTLVKRIDLWGFCVCCCCFWLYLSDRIFIFTKTWTELEGVLWHHPEVVPGWSYFVCVFVCVCVYVCVCVHVCVCVCVLCNDWHMKGMAT